MRQGINMKQYCREHEAMVVASAPSPALLTRHLEKLQWLQHERLCHLIVLALTAVAELFLADLVLLHPELNPGAAVLLLGLAVLLGFYFYHYFFLENTVQQWYRLADGLREALERDAATPSDR